MQSEACSTHHGQQAGDYLLPIPFNGSATAVAISATAVSLAAMPAAQRSRKRRWATFLKPRSRQKRCTSKPLVSPLACPVVLYIAHISRTEEHLDSSCSQYCNNIPFPSSNANNQRPNSPNSKCCPCSLSVATTCVFPAVLG